MNESTAAQVVVPLISALLGGVIVAITNSVLRRRLTNAEIGKLEAETEKIRAEAGQVRSRQQVQQHHLEQLGFVTSHFLTWNEARFLRELADGQDFEFRDEYREKDHLRRLRDLGFIEHTDRLQHIADLKRGDRLRDFLRLTEAGRTYREIAERSGDAG